MAPKRAAQVAKLPKKKSKVGAIISGISRAAPGQVDTGSMFSEHSRPPSRITISISDDDADSDAERVPAKNVVSTTIPAPATPSAAPGPASRDVAASRNGFLGTFCHFCSDVCSPPHQHECVECGAIVCEQFFPRSSGCIYLGTVNVGKDAFLCPVCSRTGDGKEKQLRYLYIGFGRRKKVKMAWPMAIINLSLESMKDDYLAATVKLEAENHYRSMPHNVSTDYGTLSALQS